MEWTRKHLLSLRDLTAEEIFTILDQARAFREISTRSVKKVPALRGRVVVNLFYEPSTRTANSFALAAKRLSADTVNFSSKGSSVSKGETLLDTARNIQAMGVDIFVVRHPAPGAPELLARELDCSIINAGDGAREHPTQGLLDIFTMREIKGRIDGLHVGIVGDIRHSRVARSNIWGLLTLGAKVTIAGPPPLVPLEFERFGVETCYDIDRLLAECDVVNVLRVQFERQSRAGFPSNREYARLFGINKTRLEHAREDIIIMHPGPMNRGIEITPEVADGKQSVILEQVENGMAVRMSVLYLCALASGQAVRGEES
jgi:aspartate carbamoyltransferase catalytic subunit